MVLYNLCKKEKQKLAKKNIISKVIQNTSWLVSDKVFSMLIALFVTAIVARFFGPEQFGQFNYALAFISLFTAISTLGLETLTIKSILDKEVKENVILYTSLILRIVGGLILTVIAAVIIRIIEPEEQNLHLLVLIMSLTTVAKSFEVIEYWLQAYHASKISSIIRITAYVIASTLKLLLVYNDGSIVQFAMIYTLDAILISTALVVAYFKVREDKLPFHFSFNYAKGILSQSWYLIISGLMITLYIRIDQVMIGMMSTKSAVGIYSAAVRIAEMWFFIPMAIITSFKPLIMNNKKNNKDKYLRSVQTLYSIITWLGIGFAVIIFIFSKPIVNILYGPEFLEATNILTINIWAGIFGVLGSARAVWLITEGLQKYTLIFMAAGTLVNIVLNFFLIPQFGGEGAAFATLLTQIIVVIIMPLFFWETRISSILMFKTLRLEGFFKNRKNEKKTKY